MGSAILQPNLLLAFLAFCWSGALPAVADAPYRRDISVSYRMLSAELYEETYINSTTILSEAAIGRMSQATLSLNEHFNEWVKVEAINVKADGRVLVVPAEQILVAAAPDAPRLGVFEADVRTRTIVFGSVEVGDVLTFSRTIRTTKPVVPDGVDALLSIPPHAYYGDVRVELDAPANMRFKVSREGFTEDVRDVGDRRRYTWTFAGRPYVVPEEDSISYFDYSPFIAFSNRESDEAVGRWFFSIASPKSATTPDVARLAKDVTAGISAPREQARAVYDYVSSKIRYFHIGIGQGGWVPHAAAEVLANGFGDCKDHVTLMRAMLAAKGIAADYVLLTAGAASYRNFDVPLTRYDHVVLYLPEFGVYADPTNALLAFGALPLEAAEKWALHISAERVERRRAPPMQAAQEAVSVRAKIRVAADGRYAGEAIWEAGANQAALLRRQLAVGGAQSRAEIVAAWMQRSSIVGTGSLEASRASDHTEPFRIAMKFDADDRLFPSPTGRQAFPFGPLLIDMPHVQFLEYERAKRRLPTLCYAQNFEVVLDLDLHESLEFGPLPLPVRVETEYGVFSASYMAEGKRLQVRRAWRLQPPSMTCGKSEIDTHIMPLVNTMRRDNAMRLAIHPAANTKPN